jgi:hypothetical protein
MREKAGSYSGITGGPRYGYASPELRVRALGTRDCTASPPPALRVVRRRRSCASPRGAHTGATAWSPTRSRNARGREDKRSCGPYRRSCGPRSRTLEIERRQKSGASAGDACLHADWRALRLQIVVGACMRRETEREPTRGSRDERKRPNGPGVRRWSALATASPGFSLLRSGACTGRRGRRRSSPVGSGDVAPDRVDPRRPSKQMCADSS